MKIKEKYLTKNVPLRPGNEDLYGDFYETLKKSLKRFLFGSALISLTYLNYIEFRYDREILTVDLEGYIDFIKELEEERESVKTIEDRLFLEGLIENAKQVYLYTPEIRRKMCEPKNYDDEFAASFESIKFLSRPAREIACFIYYHIKEKMKEDSVKI